MKKLYSIIIIIALLGLTDLVAHSCDSTHETKKIMSSKSRGGLSKREYAKKYGKSYKKSSKKSSSKDRGGLSSREYEAKQAGGKLDYKTGNITVREKGKRETPAQYANRTGTDPSLASEMGYLGSPDYDRIYKSGGMSDDEYKKKSDDHNKKNSKNYEKTKKYNETFNSRLSASRAAAKKTKPVTGGDLSRLPAASISQAPQRSGVSRLWDMLTSPNRNAMQYLAGRAAPMPFGNQENQGLPESPMASALRESSTPDQPTGYGAGDEAFYNNFDPAVDGMTPMTSDFATPGTNFSRPGSETAYNQGQDTRDFGLKQTKLAEMLGSLMTPTAMAAPTPALQRPRPTQQGIDMPENLSDYQKSVQEQFGGYIDAGIDPSTDVGGGIAAANMPQPDPTPQQAFTGGTARKAYSTGTYGNGGGISAGGNLSGIDQSTQDYMKGLQKSVKGDYGMKAAKKQLENLLNSIGEQYDESERTGTNKLSEAKTEDLNKLSSLFGAYNTSDSEQRMQQEERTANTYRNTLAEMLTKLNSAESQDRTSAKNNALTNFSQIEQRKSEAQNQVAQLIYQAQQNALSRQQAAQKSSRSSGLASQKYQNQQIQDLMERGAGLPSGGREWVQGQANALGYGDLMPQMPNGWENMYNSSFGETQAPSIVSIGNGYVMNKETGDVYQAYEN